MAVNEQWEYCQLMGDQVYFLSDVTIQHKAVWPVVWRDLGLGGWELVAAGGNPPPSPLIFYFKRQVQPGRAIDDAAKA